MLITSSDLYAEGYPDTNEDAYIDARIASAQQIIENIIGTKIEAYTDTQYLDSDGEKEVRALAPIISISQVYIRTGHDVWDAIAMSNFQIADQIPHDQSNPVISIDTFNFGTIDTSAAYGRFPEGRKMVKIDGQFGLVKNSAGDPYDDLVLAVKLLAYDLLPKVGTGALSLSLEERGIEAETSDFHTFKYGKKGGTNSTGNKEVDRLIAPYVRMWNMSVHVI